MTALGSPDHVRGSSRRDVRAGVCVLVGGLLWAKWLTAPVVVSLRRRGATVPASLACWVGNPVVNLTRP
ncbi:hypothetical protein OG417_52385 [Actinoallomurus sp. NBC_01490]|jgi:hypothetical protein|uniref:hypothetical protein n=1 Tax=Actinoallomurus sp. NBC_01490 TaxID=2903557 RepID=UPI002E36E994|nr:hypothetical protein [Actinoallomurus sp. NBC_01490]